MNLAACVSRFVSSGSGSRGRRRPGDARSSLRLPAAAVCLELIRASLLLRGPSPLLHRHLPAPCLTTHGDLDSPSSRAIVRENFVNWFRSAGLERATSTSARAIRGCPRRIHRRAGVSIERSRYSSAVPPEPHFVLAILRTPAAPAVVGLDAPGPAPAGG